MMAQFMLKGIFTLVQVGRPENSIFLWPAVVTRLLTPRSRKPGYGLLLGCRSGLIDAGHEKKRFCFSSSKNLEIMV